MALSGPLAGPSKCPRGAGAVRDRPAPPPGRPIDAGEPLPGHLIMSLGGLRLLAEASYVFRLSPVLTRCGAIRPSTDC